MVRAGGAASRLVATNHKRGSAEALVETLVETLTPTPTPTLTDRSNGARHNGTASNGQSDSRKVIVGE